MKTKFLVCLTMGLFLISSCENAEDSSCYYSISESNVRSSEDDQLLDLEKLLIDLSGNKRNTIVSINDLVSDSYTMAIKAEDANPSDSTKTRYIKVYNFVENGGFAIYSADDKKPVLYGLSQYGNLDRKAAITNPGMAILVEYLRLSICGEDPLGPGLPPAGYVYYYGEWENKVYYKNGLCNVTWNQWSPYNQYCPVIDGSHAPAGCNAVAVAQFMAVHHYPKSYNGYDFSWMEMTAAPKVTDCSLNAESNVARLMEQLGSKNNLNMSYTAKESTSEFKNIPRTLKNFGYSNGGKIINYRTKDVVAELTDGNSVIVSGYSHKEGFHIGDWYIIPEYKSGHAWLCHGLLERTRKIYVYKDGVCVNTKSESNWYPLCNFGWRNSSYNGYYLSNFFDTSDGGGPVYPSDTRSDEDGYYKYCLECIVNIRK